MTASGQKKRLDAMTTPISNHEWAAAAVRALLARALHALALDFESAAKEYKP
jgi:hypothetical protein